MPFKTHQNWKQLTTNAWNSSFSLVHFKFEHLTKRWRDFRPHVLLPVCIKNMIIEAYVLNKFPRYAFALIYIQIAFYINRSKMCNTNIMWSGKNTFNIHLFIGLVCLEVMLFGLQYVRIRQYHLFVLFVPWRMSVRINKAMCILFKATIKRLSKKLVCIFLDAWNRFGQWTHFMPYNT